MQVSKVTSFLAMGGPISSWINTCLIILGIISGAIYYFSSRDNVDAVTTAQVNNILAKIEESKVVSAKAADDAKKAQVEALDKLTKDLTSQLTDVRSKQDTTSGQIQTILITNQGFSGRFDVIDQKLVQITRQADSNDGRIVSLENRMSKTETNVDVLRALVERSSKR